MEQALTDRSGINRPSAPEAETALVACIIDEPSRFGPKAMEAQLTTAFFYGEANAALFGIVMDRLRTNRPVDPSSLKDDIRKAKIQGLGVSTLASILNAEMSHEGWDGYLDAIRDTYSRRLLINGAIAAETQDGRTALDTLRIASEIAQAAISGQTAVKGAKAAVDEFIQALTERHENGLKPGLSTGVDVIDEHTGGMRKGELWVIGAKTSGGKSILMLQMAAEPIQQGKRVAIFTLELGVDEVIGRIVSCMGRIPISQIMNPKTLSPFFMNKVTEQAQKLAETGLMVCDSADLTMDTIAGHCLRMKETDGLDLVVIDYIQMVSAPRVKGQNREQEVASISKACKQLAKRLKCPVLTATQLNEENKARESRAIENDADNLIVIEHDKNGQSSIQMWKCRNGKRGTVYKAVMDGSLQSFKISN